MERTPSKRKNFSEDIDTPTKRTRLEFLSVSDSNGVTELKSIHDATGNGW